MKEQRAPAVLIVEDELLVAKDLQQTLLRMGYDAFAIAASADEAVARASEQRPDIVLMDIRIKGEKDGIETAQLLRSRFRTPIVYLSAHSDEAMIMRAKTTEPDGYLLKPIKTSELRGVIEIAIYKHDLEGVRARALELEMQKDALLTAARLKDEFLTNMSHELRTPLNGMLGFAELMRDGMSGPLNERQQDFLNQVLTSGQRFVRLIENVLALSTVEARKLEFHTQQIDLVELVQEVLEAIGASEHTNECPLQLDIDPTCRHLVNDRALLRQVLYGYLSNAFKFSPAGRGVTFRAVSADPGWLRLEVSDKGDSIPAQDLHRLFVAFQQLDSGTRKKYQGAGLGLALIKHIAEAQGGHAGYESQAAGGNTFFAVVPRVLEGAPKAVSGEH